MRLKYRIYLFLADGLITTTVDISSLQTLGYECSVWVDDGYTEVGPKTLTVRITGNVLYILLFRTLFCPFYRYWYHDLSIHAFNICDIHKYSSSHVHLFGLGEKYERLGRLDEWHRCLNSLNKWSASSFTKTRFTHTHTRIHAIIYIYIIIPSWCPYPQLRTRYSTSRYSNSHDRL